MIKIDRIKKMRQLTKLMQVPTKRRLDINCKVFIHNWIVEERQKAQKELLKELKKDFAEGNPSEHICMKFIDKLDENFHKIKK